MRKAGYGYRVAGVPQERCGDSVTDRDAVHRWAKLLTATILLPHLVVVPRMKGARKTAYDSSDVLPICAKSVSTRRQVRIDRIHPCGRDKIRLRREG